MEPRKSMTAYALILSGTTCVTATMGVPALATVIGLLVLLHGGGLWFVYRRWRRQLARPSSREALDPIVLRQWLFAGVISAGAGALVWAFDVRPLHQSPLELRTFAFCGAVAVAAVFISSLIDWYWILPRVAGVVCPAPCEAPGHEYWTYLTNHWIFHRVIAELLVSGAIIAWPTAMAGATTGSAQALWGVGTVIAAGSIGYREKFVVAAIINAGDARTKVGDVVRIRHEVDEDDVWSWAYVLDVSLRGAKIVLLQGLRFNGRRFDRKGDFLLASDAALAAAPRSRETQLCTFRRDGSGTCSGVNWYCRNNSRAHRQSSPEPVADAIEVEPPRPAAPERPRLDDGQT
jgi:hypothetical protein